MTALLLVDGSITRRWRGRRPWGEVRRRPPWRPDWSLWAAIAVGVLLGVLS